jgi:hypothetical protein
VTLSAGFRLGLYEILSPLGAGGMGEVYLLRFLRGSTGHRWGESGAIWRL